MNYEEPSASTSVSTSTPGIMFQSTLQQQQPQQQSQEQPPSSKKVQKAGKNYDIKKMLGQSYICRVHLAIDTRDGKHYALKCYPKKVVKSEQKLEALRREVRILQICRHRYIQSLREIVVGESHFYIVVEFVSSILSDGVVDARHLSEDEARKYFQKIIVALRHCHRNGVVHRDLKLDKVLVVEGSDGCGGGGVGDDIKLTGFDVAEFQSNGETLPTCFSTFANSAPEVLSGQDYDGFAADIFASVSSILYPMLFGVHPFENSKKSVTFSNIENCEYSFPSDIAVSDEAKDFISRVLVQDPDERMKMNDILRHPWFEVGFDASQLDWGRESAGIQRAQSQLEDSVELGKLVFDSEQGGDVGRASDADGGKTAASPIISPPPSSSSFSSPSASTLRRSAGGDVAFDKLLRNFPPNFIFSASDIEMHGAPIGAGGAGSVYKARIKSVGWDVAAKLFRDRESIERAILECEQSLKLRHKNLVQTIGVAAAKSAFSTDLVMLMELGDESLDSLVRREQENAAQLLESPDCSSLSYCHHQHQHQQKRDAFFDRIWSYAKQITEALAFLHSRTPRILHLDTKPSNVVLFQRGTVAKLCDLGISRVCSDASNPAAASVTRAGVGTLRFCSRQQLACTTLDAQCDVYSLGATIFALIDETWEPWKGKTIGEITQGDLLETLKHRKGCPQNLIDLCRSCLEPDLEKRPKDAIEVFVKTFLRGDSTTVPATSNDADHQDDEMPNFLKEYFCLSPSPSLKNVLQQQGRQHDRNSHAVATMMTFQDLVDHRANSTNSSSSANTGGSFTPSSASRTSTQRQPQHQHSNQATSVGEEGVGVGIVDGVGGGVGEGIGIIGEKTETFDATSYWAG